jgi:hypothetical protein
VVGNNFLPRLRVVNTAVVGLCGAELSAFNSNLTLLEIHFFLSLLKNTPITGFFVCQRKGKFDIGVISKLIGKAF